MGKAKKEKKVKMTKAEKRRAEAEREAASGIRVRYYPRSFLWNVLAVTLAFLFGIFASLCGLFGVGLLFAAKTSPKGLFGDSYTSYVKDEYSELSLLELAQELLTTINEIATAGGEFTLNVIAKYTPIFESLLDPLSESLAGLGVTFDVNAFLNVPISGMGSFFQEDVLNPTVLGSALGVTPESEEVLIALCYGERGYDYEVVDGEFVMLNGKKPLTFGDLTSGNESMLDRLTVELVFGVNASSNAAMRYLAYGSEGTHYIIDEEGQIVMLRNAYTGELFRKKHITDLANDGQESVENARIRDLIDLDDNSTEFLKAIADWKISDLKQQARINRLRISQFFSIDENSSRLLKAIADWRIGDLSHQDFVDSLTLGDIVSVNEKSPKLLRALEYTPLGEVGSKMNTLRLSDILEESDIAGNKLLRNLGMSTLGSLAKDIQALSVAEVFGQELYSYMEYDPDRPETSYLGLLKAYDEGRNGENAAIPEPIPANATITKHYSRDGLALNAGWFCLEDELYRLVNASEVYRLNGAENGVSYYVERRLPIEAEIEYRLLNFADDTSEKLPESAFGTVTEGYADGTVQSTAEPVLRNGLPLYYYTERVRPTYAPDEEPEQLSEEAGDELPEESLPSDMEPVRYPVLQDDFGVFCLYLSVNGTIERIDFEEVPIAYTAAEGLVEPILDGEGKLVHDKVLFTNGGEPVETRVYHAAATLDAESGEILTAAYDYIIVHDEVEQRYYQEIEGNTEYAETYPLDDEKVSTLYTASWTAAEGGAERTDVPVDRFLNGFWYVLFGGEIVDESGEITGVVDHTETPLLDISANLTNASKTMNDLPLWKLYFHGMVTANPYLVITNGPNGASNLNELTISEAIKYFTDTLGSIGG